MTESTNPFLDERRRDALYGDASRLTQRTAALHDAKIEGEPVASVIAGFGQVGPDHLLDVGCGRGGTTAHLTRRWWPREVTALDASPALLAEARRRVCDNVPDGEARVGFVAADFHDIPLPDDDCDVVVAAFCLYHSPAPETVLAEFRRCLRPGGRAILVTKSADSYATLDELAAASELAPDAHSRSSLYDSFHSGNAESVVSEELRVQAVRHDRHRFQFADADHLAAYLATNPRYSHHAPETLAERFASVLKGHGVTTESTVTYVVASAT